MHFAKPMVITDLVATVPTVSSAIHNEAASDPSAPTTTIVPPSSLVAITSASILATVHLRHSATLLIIEPLVDAHLVSSAIRTLRAREVFTFFYTFFSLRHVHGFVRDKKYNFSKLNPRPRIIVMEKMHLSNIIMNFMKFFLIRKQSHSIFLNAASTPIVQASWPVSPETVKIHAQKPNRVSQMQNARWSIRFQ